MTWRDVHSVADKSTLKIPVDNGTSGAYLLASEVAGAAPATTTIAQTDAITDLTADFLIPVDNGSQNGAHLTRAQLIALELANDGSVDITQTTALTSWPSDGQVLILTGGAFKLIAPSLVPASGSGSNGGGSTATAPSQVGSLTATTTTSTTIAVTYTAATGTAPITYTGWSSPHGANSYTQNGGTFSATGGTFTGLTASTAYDLQIRATNSAGTSTTTLTNDATAVGSGGSGTSNPSVVWSTQPTFETANPISGAASLLSGVGRVTFTLPANANGNSLASYKLGFRLRSKLAGAITKTANFITLTCSNGGNKGFNFRGNTNITYKQAGNYSDIAGNVRDQAVHYIELSDVGNYGAYDYCDVRIDGGSAVTTEGGNNAPPVAGTAYLDIDMTQLATGDVLDAVWVTTDTSTHDVPSGEPSRDANTLVLLTFNDQTGNGS